MPIGQRAGIVIKALSGNAALIATFFIIIIISSSSSHDVTYLQTLKIAVSGLCDGQEAEVEVRTLKSAEVYWISVAGVLAQTEFQRHMSAISVTPHTLLVYNCKHAQKR